MNTFQELHHLLGDSDLWQSTVELKRGDPLVLPGSVDRNLYRVEEGIVVVCRDVSGDQRCIRFGYAGELVLCLDSYITGTPTSYSLLALRRTVVSVAPFERLRHWLGASDANRIAWEDGKEWLIAGLLEREIDLLTPSPEERYRRVLARSPRLFQEVPAKYIANYLRMTPETLSRLKKEIR